MFSSRCGMYGDGIQTEKIKQRTTKQLAIKCMLSILLCPETANHIIFGPGSFSRYFARSEL